MTVIKDFVITGGIFFVHCDPKSFDSNLRHYQTGNVENTIAEVWDEMCNGDLVFYCPERRQILLTSTNHYAISELGEDEFVSCLDSHFQSALAAVTANANGQPTFTQLTKLGSYTVSWAKTEAKCTES